MNDLVFCLAGEKYTARHFLHINNVNTDVLCENVVKVENFFPIFTQLNFINDNNQPDFRRYLKSATSSFVSIF